MTWRIVYYSERVSRQVLGLPAGILADYLRIVELLQEHGVDLGMPHARAFGQGLFELRPRGREGIGRVFYCTAVGNTIVVLHGFVKKTQETPRKELDIARKRAKEVKRYGKI
jgi:phage-related protein